jgi:hypothetical protein
VFRGHIWPSLLPCPFESPWDASTLRRAGVANLEASGMSTLQEFQAAITGLSSGERETLLSWLPEAGRKVWDEEISRDFSEGGAAMHFSPALTSKSAAATSIRWSSRHSFLRPASFRGLLSPATMGDPVARG